MRAALTVMDGCASVSLAAFSPFPYGALPLLPVGGRCKIGLPCGRLDSSGHLSRSARCPVKPQLGVEGRSRYRGRIVGAMAFWAGGGVKRLTVTHPPAFEGTAPETMGLWRLRKQCFAGENTIRFRVPSKGAAPGRRIAFDGPGVGSAQGSGRKRSSRPGMAVPLLGIPAGRILHDLSKRGDHRRQSPPSGSDRSPGGCVAGSKPGRSANAA